VWQLVLFLIWMSLPRQSTSEYSSNFLPSSCSRRGQRVVLLCINLSYPECTTKALSMSPRLAPANEFWHRRHATSLCRHCRWQCGCRLAHPRTREQIPSCRHQKATERSAGHRHRIAGEKRIKFSNTRTRSLALVWNTHWHTCSTNGPQKIGAHMPGEHRSLEPRGEWRSRSVRGLLYLCVSVSIC